MANTQQNPLIGRTITDIRRLTDEEHMQIFGYRPSISDIPTLIILDDGSERVPFQDPEGNGSGILMHFVKDDATTTMSGDILVPPKPDDENTE